MEENSNNISQNKNFYEQLSKNYNLIMSIAATIAVIYPIINYIYQYIFKVDSEAFYGIPREYFTTDINSRLIYLLLTIILFMCFLFPVFFRSYEKKQGNNSKTSLIYSLFLSFLFGSYFGVINLYYFVEIIKVHSIKIIFFTKAINWMAHYIYFIGAVLFTMGVIAVSGIILINEIKNKRLYKLFTVIFIISSTISIFLFIYGTSIKLGTSIEDKTKYEFVTHQGENYVVLSEKEEHVLAVKYSVDKSVEKNEYIFNTREYLFLEKDECIYSYIDIKTTPTIAK